MLFPEFSISPSGSYWHASSGVICNIWYVSTLWKSIPWRNIWRLYWNFSLSFVGCHRIHLFYTLPNFHSRCERVYSCRFWRSLGCTSSRSSDWCLWFFSHIGIKVRILIFFWWRLQNFLTLWLQLAGGFRSYFWTWFWFSSVCFLQWCFTFGRKLLFMLFYVSRLN